MKIFSGSSHPAFTRAICDYLGMPVAQSHTVTFSNENMLVQIDENVRGSDVFVVQTSCPPVHTHIVETLIMIDALRSASASRITAVIPYFPYIRSDKKDRPRISIAARLMADLLETAGADRVLTMDLHTPQSQGFFRMPVDQLQGAGPLSERLREMRQDDWIMVAADAGEAKDVGRFASLLDLPMAIIDKRRDGDTDVARAVGLIGDVRGKVAVVVDDEIASGGTLVEAANYLKKHGATRVIAAATHPVLSANAVQRINEAPIEKVLVTDTIPLPTHTHSDKIEVVSVAPMFAEAIARIRTGTSVSEIFEPATLRQILKRDTIAD